MDLISRKALLNDMCEDREEGTFDFTDEQAEAADKIIRYIIDRIQAQPSVPAVPLDKLCEWLARNAFAFECEDCEEYCKALLDCEHEVGSDQEYWKNKLTKWMEEQDAAD